MRLCQEPMMLMAAGISQTEAAVRLKRLTDMLLMRRDSRSTEWKLLRIMAKRFSIPMIIMEISELYRTRLV